MLSLLELVKLSFTRCKTKGKNWNDLVTICETPIFFCEIKSSPVINECQWHLVSQHCTL